MARSSRHHRQSEPNGQPAHRRHSDRHKHSDGHKHNDRHGHTGRHEHKGRHRRTPRPVKRGDVVKLAVAITRRGPPPKTTSTTRLGVVRRVHADVLHVHWAQRSAMAPGQVVLLHARCRDVPARSVVRVLGVPWRWVYDREGLAWRDAGASRGRCDGCAGAAGAERRADEIHVGDLVLLHADSGGTYDLGLRTNLPSTAAYTGPPGHTVKLRRLGRVAALPGAHGHVSERRVYLTNEVTRVPVSRVAGRGVLNVAGHASSFTCTERLHHGAAHFSRLEPVRADDRALRPCAPCRAAAEADAADTAAFAALRLNSADLYAGGGGSVLGALGAGFSVRHAVDDDGVCIATLRANECMRHVGLRRMSVEAYARDVKQGHLALVFAGPPCQGHSGANRHRRVDDPRNAEIWTALDAVQRILPDVLVLENVRGIKDERDGDERGHGAGDEHSVNFAREAVKRLLAMGYQARLALLDARAYGSPQSRLRLFVLAARRGIPLPAFPTPTHAARPPQTLLHIDGVTEHLSLRYRGAGAPFPPLTLTDAISDLPAFDLARHPRGFDHHVRYARPPANDFQATMRRGGDRLADHITEWHSAGDLAIIEAASRPGAENLPGALRCAEPQNAVNTLLRSPHPGRRGTGVIHPTQARMFTVAERKRFQGFPDTYHFAGGTRAANKMIGNAVCVQVAEAICRQVKHDVYFEYWKANGKPETKTFWRIWRKSHPVVN